MLGKIIVVLFLAVTVQSLNNYTFDYSLNTYSLGTTDLKSLTAGTVLTFKLTFPYITATRPSSFKLILYSGTSGTLANPQPTSFNTLHTKPSSPETLNYTWTVGQDGDYYLRV